MRERVNHPEHYNKGSIEVIDIIEVWGLGFHLGNALKYILRAPFRGQESTDLAKCAWYLHRYANGEEGIWGGPDTRTLADLSPKHALRAWGLEGVGVTATVVKAIAMKWNSPGDILRVARELDTLVSDIVNQELEATS
jgi:hypothetical protein